ncbi:hypothetical protein NMG60_11033900 [Bertholletia excelsa]
MPDSGGKNGGWITFPFITVTVIGLGLATGGWLANLVVYLIKEFNVKNIDAAQIANVVNGCTSLFPVLGATVADSFGCFPVVAVSSFISFLGILLLALTTISNSLRPPSCEDGSSLCTSPSTLQFAILFSGITLASLGSGGSRFTLATIGANQFGEPKDQATFFNWFFFTLYASSAVSATAIVYIEDNVSWAWGFALSFGANLLALIVFLLGRRFYRRVKPQGSPFMDLARVIVAAIRKRKAVLSSSGEDYSHGHDGSTRMVEEAVPSSSFRFLNHAALKTEADNLSGLITQSWTLSTVKQVEDLKTLIRILPLWSTGVFLSTPIGVQSSLVVLQALTMDRQLGPNFQIPAGSILVFVLISTSVSLPLIVRFLIPTWQKLTGQSPTLLQRVGVGHVLNVISMVISAFVESKRLRMARTHHVQSHPDATVPMLALWLLPQLAVIGIAEAFHFPGQVALYYQEFPASLKSTSTAMIAMLIAIAFYLSTALIDFIRSVSDWLPDNINKGRLDNVYWVLVGVGVVNFGYYLVCAKLYKYQNIERGMDEARESEKQAQLL